MTQTESPKSRAKIGILKIRDSDFLLVSDFDADFLL